MRSGTVTSWTTWAFAFWLMVGGVAGGADKKVPSGKPVAAAAAVKLTPKQIEWLQMQVRPAYAAGNSPAVVMLIRESLTKQTAAVRGAMNDRLAAEGAPSLERMLADSRLAVLRAGMMNALPAPSPQELPLLVNEYERQVAELLDQAQAKPIFADPLASPQSLKEFRDLLWSAHVLNNELMNAGYLASQAELIAKSAPPSRAKPDAKQPEANVAQQFADERTRAARMSRELTERALELRLKRIELALKFLEESADVGERLQAAYALGVDGEQVQAALQRVDLQPFGRAALNAEELVEKVRSQVERGQELAGDLMTKSRALYAGLHWWRRGRYGRGPEHFGLVKWPAAQTNIAANIPLLMPLDAPRPTDPAQTGGLGVPDYDRRHHYWWSWESIQFELRSTSTSLTSTSTALSQEKLGHFDGFISGRFY